MLGNRKFLLVVALGKEMLSFGNLLTTRCIHVHSVPSARRSGVFG